MSLLVPCTCYPVYLHLLLMHTFGLMLTQCSLHTCLPLLAVIFLNASLTHFVLRAQLLFFAPSLPLSTSSLHSCICFTHTMHLPLSSCSVHILLTSHSLYSLFTNIPSAPAYGVYASQLVRYAHCCSSYSDFLIHHRAFVERLLSQGYKVNRLSNTFKKFYGRHTDLVGQYKKNVCQMFADSIS